MALTTQLVRFNTGGQSINIGTKEMQGGTTTYRMLTATEYRSLLGVLTGIVPEVCIVAVIAKIADAEDNDNDPTWMVGNFSITVQAKIRTFPDDTAFTQFKLYILDPHGIER